MAHFPTVEGYWPIYVRWVNRGSWKVVESHEITAEEIRKMTTTSVALAPECYMRQSSTV
jgi:hypothetical protein